MSTPTPNAVAPLSEERVREYEQMLSAVTPGPWTCEVDVRPWEESAHYVIRTVENQPATPWSPRFVAWMNGGRQITPQRFAEMSPAERARLMDEGVRDDQRIEPDARFIAASPTIVAALLADRTALSARVAELEADAKRLDWLEAHAMRDDFEDRAGIRIERFTGSPDQRFNDACFRLREWGDTPLDRDGELDYSQRLYRQSDHATLREAIDAAMTAASR